MNSSSRSTALIRMDGRILFASTYFCELVGIHYSKVAGMSYFDFVFPEDSDAARQLLQSKHLDEDPFTFRLKRLDGTAVWVEIRLTAMKWPEEKKTYAVSAVIIPTTSGKHGVSSQTGAVIVEGREAEVLQTDAPAELRAGLPNTLAK